MPTEDDWALEVWDTAHDDSEADTDMQHDDDGADIGEALGVAFVRLQELKAAAHA
jgi:esterase/lipase superfamily enzyme